jgi:hypothetical protein
VRLHSAGEEIQEWSIASNTTNMRIYNPNTTTSNRRSSLLPPRRPRSRSMTRRSTCSTSPSPFLTAHERKVLRETRCSRLCTGLRCRCLGDIEICQSASVFRSVIGVPIVQNVAGELIVVGLTFSTQGARRRDIQ